MFTLLSIRFAKKLVPLFIIYLSIVLFLIAFNKHFNVKKRGWKALLEVDALAEFSPFTITIIIGGFSQKYVHMALSKFKEIMAQKFPNVCGNRKYKLKFNLLQCKSVESLSTTLGHISKLQANEKQLQLNNKALHFFSEIEAKLEKDSGNISTVSHFLAGSIEEGYSVPFSYRENIPDQFNGLCSDYDVMFSLELYRASFSHKGNTTIEILNVESDAKLLPVYCQLHFQHPDKGKILLDSCKLLNNLQRAVDSSSVWNLPFGFNDVFNIRTNLKGPSVRVTIGPPGDEVFEGDTTLCIKCMEWPSLSDWPTRCDRLWPRKSDVKKICSYGFHFVANPILFHGTCLSTWRYSFSLAEVKLSKLVPNTARKCFLALKIILKDHLKTILPELSSYHIKTVFLNTLEKKPKSFWVDKNIEECLQTLLQELHRSLVNGHCRHFWLKDSVNLFSEIPEHKQTHLSTLATKVEFIMKDPCSFINDTYIIDYVKNKMWSSIFWR